MYDPIEHYFEKYSFDQTKIKELVCGQKYVAVLLQNGNIGVCATYGMLIHHKIPEAIDLSNLEHRILLNAYFNALLNYEHEYDDEKDIFELIDFKQYKNIVMVGNFKPVVKRFQNAGINLSIFDKKEDEEILTNMKNQIDFIKKADAIILTATTVYNQSFSTLIEHTAENASVFILGPSSIMHMAMKNYRNVKMIFGSVFEPFDYRVLDLIRANQGTRAFGPLSRKVYL